jgi:outer membrane protein assembly factor BamD
MRNRSIRFTAHVLVLAAALIGAGCASGGPPIERLAPQALFERGVADLEARRFTEAARAFERLLMEYPTHPRVADARYHLAETYVGRREYVTAAMEFARFATDYPSSARSADARFQVCEAYRQLSPEVQRDQEYTRAAVEHCRALIAYYPASPHVPAAERIIQEMMDKLADKEFAGGDFYFRRRAFDSAIIYFENVVREFPASPAAPRALLRLVEAYGSIGYDEEAAAARERLVREYPSSAEARQVQEGSFATGS